ncbi:SPOR domain-containing protein [bacterium]|nr:SPOR domain-containing protein [bacterium]
MDKFKDSINLTPALIVKLVLVLVLLLTFAFVSGVVIGKKGSKSGDRTSLDEEGMRERYSNCSALADEYREKYMKLRDEALERGLVDKEYVIKSGVVCKPAEKNAEPPVEPETVETSHETSPKEKPAETVETKPAETVETSPEASPKEKPKPAETKPAETKPVEKPAEPKSAEPKKSEKTEKPAENKTIDEILTEKKAAPKKEDGKKCRFSIQLASLNSEEQVAAAKKQFKSLKLRVLSSESNGVKSYKIRTGCFDSREDADAELPQVKNSVKDAFIVSE